jgi:hypothetical protein
MICLFLRATLNARFYPDGVEIGFRFCVLGGAHDVDVGVGGDLVGFADEGDFVGRLGYTAGFDGGFEEGELFVGV